MRVNEDHDRRAFGVPPRPAERPPIAEADPPPLRDRPGVPPLALVVGAIMAVAFAAGFLIADGARALALLRPTAASLSFAPHPMKPESSNGETARRP